MRGETRHRAWLALAALLLSSGPAAAAVRSQFEPVLRMGGGADSNVLFDGGGGDLVGRAAAGFRYDLTDRHWSARLDARGSLVGFQDRQRLVMMGEVNGRMLSRLGRHSNLALRTRVRAADDPLALAQMGILGGTGLTLMPRGSAELTHRLDRQWTMAGLLTYHGVHFLDSTAVTGGDAVMLNFQPRYRWNRVLELRPAIEGRTFFTDGWLGSAVGVFPGARVRLARRTHLEASGGPLLYVDAGGQLPLWVARGNFVYEGRRLGAMFTAAHDLTVPAGRGGILSGQIFEGMLRYGTQHTELRMRGGYYRSHPSPRDLRWVPGYGVEASAFRRLTENTWLGASAMRFERMATAHEPAMARDAIFIHMDWTGGRP